MLPHDPTGRNGPKNPQPDVVKVRDPKEDELVPTPAYGQSAPEKQ